MADLSFRVVGDVTKKLVDLGDSDHAEAVSIAASGVTGGIPSTARLVSAANIDNATVAKASAGRVFAIQGYNANAAVRYLKLYNKATAPSSADTPRRTMALPPSAGFAFDWADIGLAFTTGISYRIVTGSADNDNTSVTAADIVGLNIDYA